MVISESPAESRRFGLRVGRCEVPPGSTQVDTARIRKAVTRFDVLICRYPARFEQSFAELLLCSDHHPIYADTLLHWESALPPQIPLPDPAESHHTRFAPVEDLESLVLPIFSEYESHYTANPLFKRKEVLKGYVEWVSDIVGSERGDCLVVVTPNDAAAAFAVMTTGDHPDIKLGGVSEQSRGSGLYRVLIEECMRHVWQLGRDRVMISTQAHNLRVMSSWITLGFKPIRAETTVHLVRNSLLAKVLR